jgi:hypothetical protein
MEASFDGDRLAAEGRWVRLQNGTDWLTGIRRYLVFVALSNLAWEILQLPLYAIWKTGTWRNIVIAVFHCTAGDVIIATTALAVALAFFGDRQWPIIGRVPVALTAVTLGIGYTIFSEWMNLVVRKSWAYSDLMPVVPLLGTGISPLAQWIVIPGIGLLWARRPMGGRGGRE